MNITEMRELAAKAEDLGEEQNQLKSLVGQIQRTINQVLVTSREQAEKLQALAEELSQVTPQVTRLLPIKDELRQAQGYLARLGETQTELREHFEQSERLRQAEIEREHQARSQLWEKQEPLEQEQASLRSRLASMEEMTRRLREELPDLRHQLGDLKQQDATLDGRFIAFQQFTKQQEQELARLNQELETLHRQDEAVSGRIQVLAELMRQVDERSSGKAIEERLHQELGERVERVRVEIQRLDGQVFDLSKNLEEHSEETSKLAGRLGHMETQVRSQRDHLEELINMLKTYRQQMTDSMMSFADAEEQQKRQQIDDLERQIQELKRRAMKWGSS